MGVIRNIQLLRFVAAGLVLIRHFFDMGFNHHLLASEVGFAGGAGVDLFFVISGFVMMLTADNAFQRPGAPARFMLRRVQRIVPLYWIFTTLTLLVMVALPSQMNHNDVDWRHVLASYFFIPFARSSGGIAPVLSLGWTLNYEMFFYVLFAIVLMFPRRVGLSLLFATLILLACTNQLFSIRQPQLFFWTYPIILEFAAGCLLALVYRSGVRLPMVIAIPAIVIAAVLTPAGIESRWFYWGVPAAIITSAVALMPDLGYKGATGRLLLLLGDASYALYLSHPFTATATRILIQKLHLGFGSYLAIGLPASLAVSVGVHLLIEVPIRDRLIRRREAAPAGAVALGTVTAKDSNLA